MRSNVLSKRLGSLIGICLVLSGCATAKSDLPVREELEVIEVEIDDGNYIHGCIDGVASALYSVGYTPRLDIIQAGCMELFLRQVKKPIDREQKKDNAL